MLPSLKSVVILLSALWLCAPTLCEGRDKNTFQTPDFDFPEEVEANARPVLEQALHSGNQNKAVQATLQICESRLTVSDHNINSVLTFIDSVCNVGKLTPDYRALFYIYESKIIKRLNNYYIQKSGDDESEDIYLWSSAKQDSLKHTFLEKALDPLGNGDITPLLTPITKYKDIVSPGDKWGQRCMPYLYDLAAHINSHNFDSGLKSAPNRSKDFEKQWLAAHAKDKDLYATIYIEKDLNVYNDIEELFKKYRYKEEIGLVLCEDWTDFDELQYVNFGKEYIKKFPHSPFVSYIKDCIDEISIIQNGISFTPLIASNQPLKAVVKFNSLFTSRTKLSLYRLPQNLKPYKTKRRLFDWEGLDVTEYYRTKQLERVEEVIVEKGKENESKSATFKPVPYGIYFLEVAIESPQGGWFSPKDYETYEFKRQLITVSDIRSFVIQEDENEAQIFAINAADGSPMFGVSVWSFDRTIDKQSLMGLTDKVVSASSLKGSINEQSSLMGLTNKEGCLTVVPRSNHYYTNYSLTKGNDRYTNDPITDDLFSFRKFNNYDRRNSIEGTIFTDLSIYRPGDNLQATILLYERSATKREPYNVPSTASSVTLYDSNGKAIENRLMEIDEWGQARVCFKIPTDRMNGTFHLGANIEGADIRSKYFEVSEYKAPTFYIDLSNTQTKQALGKSAIIRGKVLSFSGMPLSFRKVKCVLTPSSFWRWDYSSVAKGLERQEFNVFTDEAGNFEYVCPAEWTTLEEDNKAGLLCRVFQVQVMAECTNASGETQSASCSFRLGKGRRISLDEDEFLLTHGEAAHLPILFESTEENETEALCEYSLLSKGKGERVQHGVFSTSTPDFDWDRVPSGCYTFKASIKDDDSAIGIEKEIILFRATDTTVPAGKEGLWIPQSVQSVTPEGTARILIGNSNPCHIYYIAKTRTHIVDKKWIEYPAGLHWFELPMPEGKDEKLDVEFFTCIDGKMENPTATLLSPNQDEIHLKTVTFRDKVTPSSKQHWTLQLTDGKGQPVEGRMLLDIYNMALEKLNSNKWDFTVKYTNPIIYNSTIAANINSAWGSIYAKYPLEPKRLGFWHITAPDLEVLNIYRYQGNGELCEALQGRIAGLDVGAAGGIRSLGRKLVSKLAAPKSHYSNSVYREVAEDEEVVMGYGMASSQKAETALENISVRTSKTHVALWRPTLTSDEKGNFQIEFDVPDDNTTWCMQALAFSRTMATCLMLKEILAQRTLMAQPSLPRFLRSGDKTTLMANVQNAADSAVQAVALVELFDPRTDKVLKSKQFNLSISAKGTEVVSIECEAPVTEPYIGFRIKVVDGQGNGDGEQQKLPILPSTSPVIEGQPFFLPAGQHSLTLDVHRPSAIRSHSVLMACSNPTWYCISALPSIAHIDQVTSTGLAHNLFALSMAASLIKNEPALDKVSQLRQNEDLKVTTLQASPWAKAADQQEERMQALSRLLNPEQNQADYNALMDKLLKLQNEDGGFRWFDNQFYKESSYWSTSTVLQLLGRLHQLGCLRDEEKVTEMLNKALQYMDKEVISFLKDDLLESGRVDAMDYADYAYICTLYDKDRPYKSAAIKLSTNLLRNKILSAMEKKWREESLTNRAFCAVTLSRSGHEKEAQRIVESFRQLAINDPDKGMYWEKLKDGLWSHPVAHTATILEAMNEVAPEKYASEIERVRQWLLLEKQTSDWGGSSLAADAVYALLRTGGDWLHAEVDTTPQLQIKIDGKTIDYNALNPLLGNMRMDLPDGARKVEIVNPENHPAWGAVVHQYEASMQDIRKQSVKELSIRKELWAQDDKGEWQRLSLAGKDRPALHIGQKVQVRLIVTCDKALEYLTLTDERPASLEPVDYLSHYGWKDCIYYQETKDSQTNFFIRRLPAGVYTFSYDCHVTNSGSFSVGIATIQSQYAPQFVAHSQGGSLGSEK